MLSINSMNKNGVQSPINSSNTNKKHIIILNEQEKYDAFIKDLEFESVDNPKAKNLADKIKTAVEEIKADIEYFLKDQKILNIVEDERAISDIKGLKIEQNALKTAKKQAKRLSKDGDVITLMFDKETGAFLKGGAEESADIATYNLLKKDGKVYLKAYGEKLEFVKPLKRRAEEFDSKGGKILKIIGNKTELDAKDIKRIAEINSGIKGLMDEAGKLLSAGGSFLKRII